MMSNRTGTATSPVGIFALLDEQCKVRPRQSAAVPRSQGSRASSQGCRASSQGCRAP